METMLEAARRWVEWAYGTFSAQRYSDAAYNLDQFDGVAGRLAATYLSDEDQRALDGLKAKAYILRSLMAERQTWDTSASWWAPFLPGTAQDSIRSASAEATRYADMANQAADAAGIPRLSRQAVIQASEVKNELPKELQNAPNAYTDFLSGSMLGIPVWAWGLGALGLGFLIFRRK